MSSLIIRSYRPVDCKEMADLFYDTVHSVNARDYTKAQLDAWATGKVDFPRWNASFLEHTTVVAVEDSMIIGFADMERSGYLDRLYVHKDYQGRGVATALCDVLEQTVQGSISTHASITAKGFFLKRGYQTIKEQQVERYGVLLTNFLMVKDDKGGGIMASSKGYLEYILNLPSLVLTHKTIHDHVHHHFLLLWS